MTYSVFLQVMSRNLLEAAQIKLLVLDDCQFATKNQEFIASIKTLNAVIKTQQPRILGLSAPFVNDKIKPNHLAHLINHLESSFHSVVQTSNSILSALQ